MGVGKSTPRNRWYYSVLILLVIVLGLSSRRYGSYLPEFISLFSGDALWALMVYLGFGFLFPSRKVTSIAAFAIIFSFGVEFSQLYHAPWIDQLRSTILGALVLGSGFLFSDLICYTTGIFIGSLCEMYVLHRRNKNINWLRKGN
jgi:hypothetical protein